MKLELPVSDEDIAFAKKQVEEFIKIPEGSRRYKEVEAWRGVVCEMVVGRRLEENYKVQTKVKGLDASGIYDECDLVINGKKVEIKSATKNHFRYLMPKIYDVNTKFKDIYVGAKYNESIYPNIVYLLGYIKRDKIVSYPIKQNKGAPYYEVPITALKGINKYTFM